MSIYRKMALEMIDALSKMKPFNVDQFRTIQDHLVKIQYDLEREVDRTNDIMAAKITFGAASYDDEKENLAVLRNEMYLLTGLNHDMTKAWLLYISNDPVKLMEMLDSVVIEYKEMYKDLG